MNKSQQPILECIGLGKTFVDGKHQVKVLSDVNLRVLPGERIAIVGVSGAGKSTLLHLMGGLDKPSHGQVLVQGKAIHQLSERSRSQLRNQTLGFVYQFHHLMPEFSVLENVCMPLLIRGIEPNEASQTAKVLLEKVGLTDRLTHRLGELSGGERQRTAIVRGLVTRPLCLLADEPTGNLDAQTAARVYQAMLELNQFLNTSLVIVTHDLSLTHQMDKVYRIENGGLVVN
jgi:lipoprotein-releasing system ATP-binding protein